MSAIWVWIVQLFSELSLADICRGIIVRIFSNIILGGSGKILSSVKASYSDEINDCLKKAIQKSIKNKEIASYIKDNDEEKYLDALKKELLSQEHNFAAGSSDEKILKSFQQELAKRPLFAVKLIKLYGQELCSTSQQILDNLNEQIREIRAIKEQGDRISDVLKTITKRTGYSLSITDSMKGDFECLIPESHFSRSDLVNSIKNRLLQCGCIYLYGGYKIGKSVLTCLVAREFAGYDLVRIPLDYQNILNVKDIVLSYNTKKRILFVIDGLSYQDETVILDLCRFISLQNKQLWLFLLNGRQALSQFTTVDLEIDEVAVPLMTVGEVKELIPQQLQVLVPPINSLSGGNPGIAILMIQALERQGWPDTEQALQTIFTFLPDSTIKDKYRSVLKTIIPSRDALRLLNRLLLVKKPFDRNVVKQLANQDPAILLPDTCFADLINIAITDNGTGTYVVTPALAKILSPDLLPQEQSNCDHWLANDLLSHGNLSELDAITVLSYLLDGGEYDNAGKFYLSFLISARPNLANYNVFIFIWLNIPLPEQMSLPVRVLIRIEQVVAICSQEELKESYPIQDLENLIRQDSVSPNLRYLSYQALYYYYGIQGQVQRALDYKNSSLDIPVRDEQAFRIPDLLWLTLSKVKTTEELFTWFSAYRKDGYPSQSLREELFNKAVSNIYETCEIDEDVVETMNAVKVRAEQDHDHLWQFAVSAEANLIFYYAKKGDVGQAEAIYQQSSYLPTEYGTLMLNYVMGLFNYQNEDVNKAASYFERSAQVNFIGISPAYVLNSFGYLGAVWIRQEPRKAVSALQQFVNHPSFNKYYVDTEKALIYGELAMAYWTNNDRPSAVSSMIRIMDYLWSHSESPGDNEIELWMKMAILLVHYYSLVFGISLKETQAIPDSDLFIQPDNNLKNDFTDSHILISTFYLYELQKKYLWESHNVSLRLLDCSLKQYKSSVFERIPQSSTIFVTCIPDLLLYDRFDDVRYIISQSTLAARYFQDSISSPEEKILTMSLFYILLYRLDKIITNEPFDESSLTSILGDFIRNCPDDCQLATYLLDVLEHRIIPDFHFSRDPVYQELLKLLVLSERRSAAEWFCSMTRIHLFMVKANGSNYCGLFWESVLLRILYYLLESYPEQFDFNISNNLIQELPKYTLFDRARVTLSAFYRLLKNPPELSKEEKDIIDVSSL